jgi:2'-5' RNA ligase superfamily
MQSIPLFSLVIFPNENQIQLVKGYKQLLKSKIGWFGSANASAHITVINFEDEQTLDLYVEQIRKYCKTVSSQKVTFNSWSSFGEKTFFIAPDEESKVYLNTIIQNLHEYLGFKNSTANAHLTIARGLDSEKMKAAKSLFNATNVHFEFNCDAIHIRRFNEQSKQYSDIIEKISFEG